MKKTKALLSIVLALCMLLQFNIIAFAKTTTVSPYTKKTYTHQDKFDTYQKINVIDVSYHNGNIDFKKVKADGVDGAFIRVGYTGYTKDHLSLNPDKNFATYIADAKAAGLEIGIYWYSQAVTVSDAKAEANRVVSELKDYKELITMPVVMDYEFASVSSGRLDSAWKNGDINKTKMTANANAFIKIIKEAGYIPSVYASKYFFYDNLDVPTLDSAAQIWLAHYATSTDYKHDFTYWQYTANGKVDGISSTYTDCNFAYLPKGESLGVSFDVSDVSVKAYTGGAIKPIPTVKLNGEKLVAGADYMVKYKNNINVGEATITVIGINDYEAYPQKTISFKIVPVKLGEVKVSSTTNNSATLKWEPIEQATEYIIQTHRSGKWVTSGTTSDTKFTVTGINSASNYKFRVAGFKEIGGEKYRGTYSETAYGTTYPKKPSLSATSTETTITLSWTKDKFATGYRVLMYNKTAKKYELYKDIEGGENNSLKITGLKKNSYYSFKVRGYKVSKSGKIYYGEKSDYLRVYTVSVSAPTLKSVSCPSSHKLKASWTSVSGATGYQYQWSTTSSFSSDYLSGTTTNSYKTITTTKNQRKYYARVRAYKVKDGKKQYSKWSAVKGVYVR